MEESINKSQQGETAGTSYLNATWSTRTRTRTPRPFRRNFSFINLCNTSQELCPPSDPVELSLELVFEILCRLPVKVLLQLRCVSKGWRTLIDSQSFVKAHLSRSIQTRKNHFLILSQYNSDVDLKSVDLDFLESPVDLHNPLPYEPVQVHRRGGLFRSQYRNLPEESQIIDPQWLRITLQGCKILVWGTCNGLVLMSSPSYPISTCLWNPSTRKHLSLPELEVPSSHTYRHDLYGFGYDSASDDYKVIKILQFENRYPESDIQYQVWVYRLQSPSWREVAKSFPRNMKCERQPGVLLFETLHWPVTVKSELDHEEHDCILAFDLKTEEYRMFSQPKCPNPEFYSRLGTLNGSLCLIYSYLPVGFDIWVMGDHEIDDSWTRLKLQSEDFISYPGGFSKAISSNGEDRWRYWDPPPFLSEVRLHIKRREHFQVSGIDHVDVCIASLVSPEGGAAIDQQNDA